jgi:hypothetical protein
MRVLIQDRHREEGNMGFRRLLLTLAIVGMVAAVALIASGGEAFAYGKAEAPLAQIEFSGNCDNPSYPFCAPPPNGVGTGGLWFWIEVDAGGVGDISGAGCGHTVGGVGGPGGAGAGSIKGEITWTYSSLKDGRDAGASFFGMLDPGDRYYLVTIPEGQKFLFPTTTGHYSFQPAHGVALQLQVAP